MKFAPSVNFEQPIGGRGPCGHTGSDASSESGSGVSRHGFRNTAYLIQQFRGQLFRREIVIKVEDPIKDKGKLGINFCRNQEIMTSRRNKTGLLAEVRWQQC